LDASLAYARHFPAINWLNSYSLYIDSLGPWYEEHFPGFMRQREKALAMLQEESNLNEIVRLVGADSLAAAEQMTLASSKMIREDFLQQNAFVDTDSYSDTKRQYQLLGLILEYDNLCRTALDNGVEIKHLTSIAAKERIGRAKTTPADQYETVYAQISKELKQQIEELSRRGEEL